MDYLIYVKLDTQSQDKKPSKNKCKFICIPILFQDPIKPILELSGMRLHSSRKRTLPPIENLETFTHICLTHPNLTFS